MHLSGLNGHLERMFHGMLPLTLLAGLRAFEPQTRPRWLIAPGVALLGALLQNGNQFTFAALGSPSSACRPGGRAGRRALGSVCDGWPAGACRWRCAGLCSS